MCRVKITQFPGANLIPCLILSRFDSTNSRSCLAFDDLLLLGAVARVQLLLVAGQALSSFSSCHDDDDGDDDDDDDDDDDNVIVFADGHQ